MCYHIIITLSFYISRILLTITYSFLYFIGLYTQQNLFHYDYKMSRGNPASGHHRLEVRSAQKMRDAFGVILRFAPANRLIRCWLQLHQLLLVEYPGKAKCICHGPYDQAWHCTGRSRRVLTERNDSPSFFLTVDYWTTRDHGPWDNGCLGITVGSCFRGDKCINLFRMP